jgi:dienelactone hydrolase
MWLPKSLALLILSGMLAMQAHAAKIITDLPAISYIHYQSPDLENPGESLTISGQLRIPASEAEKIPAVVILHGSAGLDSRGVLYTRALNKAGIATLEIDMWGARGLAGGGARPALPTLTLPDAFGALQYLANLEVIDAQRIGVLGFSWGGVMSMLAANQSYTDNYGNGLQFAAHVAHYPVCWAYTAGVPGVVFEELTGSKVFIQVGALDDYDEGGDPCRNLASSFPEVSVKVFAEAHHAWDRSQPALLVNDPFSHLGMGGEVDIIPNLAKANRSKKNAVNFFKTAFGLTQE